MGILSMGKALNTLSVKKPIHKRTIAFAVTSCTLTDGGMECSLWTAKELFDFKKPCLFCEAKLDVYAGKKPFISVTKHTRLGQHKIRET